MVEKYSIPCALNGVLGEEYLCPDSCPLYPYTLDLQEYQIIVTSGEQGYILQTQRRDQVGRGTLHDTTDAPYVARSMLKDCLNYPSVITPRQKS